MEEYTFSSARLPVGFNGFRIVQLSDLHGKQFGKDNSRLLAAVADCRPDCIVITGDLADEHVGVDFVPALLRALTAIAPTYYVSGNHEWAAHLFPSLKEMLTDAGVIYLNNTYASLTRGGDSILLAGVDDPNGYADQKTPAQLSAEIEAEGDSLFWILLAHRNSEYGTYGSLGADLIVSGHAHGGIIRLPFTDGLLGTGGQFFPNWTNGFYYDYATPLFVSRGLGGSIPVPRLFNRPEVAVLTLQSD
ncbi:MAG: metallophosphoesterase [Clostridiales bacterium]|nr:metallophosphoesterase [Clostridiales bacterium]